MVGLESIDEIIKLALFSAYIEDEEQPISLLLCAEPETGKTAAVKKGILLEGILYISDASAWGVLNEYGDALARGDIKHIVVPDLVTPLSKRWETAKGFTSFLSMIVDEGVVEVRTFAASKRFNVPVKCGAIVCITPGELRDARHKWVGMGFMSRLLPVSWSYSEATKVQIFKFIQARRYRGEERWDWELPSGRVVIDLDDRLAEQLTPYTYVYAQAMGTYGFRYQKHLQRMAMSSALADGRAKVEQKDIDKVITLSTYLNLGGSQI